jgi:hypothetical protein
VLEVGGDPDLRAPAGSDRKKKKRGRGRCWASSSARWAAVRRWAKRWSWAARGEKVKRGRKKLGRALAYQAGRERGGEERWAARAAYGGAARAAGFAG